MTTAEKRDWLFRQFANARTKGGRYYESDCREYAHFLSLHSDAWIADCFERQWTIAHVSQAEIDANCQVSDLFPA